MTMRSWMRRLFTRPVTRTIHNAPRRIRPALEKLEDRLAPATYTWNGAHTLSISLGTGESLAVDTSTTSPTFTLSGGTDTWTQSGGTATDGTNAGAVLTFAAHADINFSLTINDVGAGSGTNNVTFTAGTTTSATINVDTTTQSGSITETSGALSVSGTLTTKSTSGTTLNDTGNAVHTFNGSNTTGGDISLTNNTAATLAVSGISETGGNVTVNNTGALATSTAAVQDNTAGKSISLQATSGNLTIGSGGPVTGNITDTISLTTVTSGDILVQDAVTTGSGGIGATSVGAITESGSGNFGTTGTLTTSSATGTTLSGAGTNAVGTFTPTNTTSGDVSLTNAIATLTVTGITNGSDITVSQTGALSVTGAVTTTANGNISLTSTGGMTLSAGITAGGSGNLTLTDTGATAGNFIGIDVNNVMVQSTTGTVTLQGTGGNNGSNNYGVYIHGGGKVQTTGTSPALLSITGTAVDGTSAAIALDNGDVTSKGDVSLTGNGGSITPQSDGSGATITIGTTFGGAINTAPTVVAGGSGYPASATLDLAITGGGGAGGIVQVSTNNAGVVTGTTSLVPSGLTGAGYTSTVGAATINDDSLVTGNTVTLLTTGAGNPQIGTFGAAGSSIPLIVDATNPVNATTANGFITLQQTTANVKLGVLNAGAAGIDLTAVGTITDGNNGSGDPNLTAADGATLTTTGLNSAIGTSGDPIRTAIGALTATTYDGGVYIADSNGPGMIINSILAQEKGYNPYLNGSNQVVLNPNGIFQGTDNVSVTATGPMLLYGTVDAPDNATLTSESGHGATINITTTGGVITGATLGAGGSGYSANAIVDLSITGAGGSSGVVAVTTDGAGVVDGLAARPIVAGGRGYVDTTGAATANGEILEASAAGNVLAQTATLTADGSIGLAGDAIGLTAESFAASTTNGSIYVSETIPGTATSVIAGGASNNASVTGSGATLDVGTITALGKVTVQETGGALLSSMSTNISGQTVNLTGKSGIEGTASTPFTVAAGNLMATVTGSGVPIDINDTIALNSVSATTNDGNVSILSSVSGSLTFTANTATAMPNPGLLTASAAAVTFDNTAQNTANPSVGNVEIGDVNASSGTVNITAAGAMTAESTLTGSTVTLTAGTGIGVDPNTGIGTMSGPMPTEIDTNVTTLNATTRTGDIYISQANAFALNAATMGYSNPSMATGSDIDVINTTGNMILGAISALGMVTLNAQGGPILVDSGNGATINITSAGGVITGATLAAGGSGYVPNATVDLSITGGGGSRGVVAVTTNGAGVATGLAATPIVAGGSGYADTIGAATANNIVNVTASRLDLTASTGIGASGAAVMTSVNTLTASAGTGGLFLGNNQTLTLMSAAAGGDVSISATGDITLGATGTQGTVTAGTGEAVTLTATGELLDDDNLGNGLGGSVITAASVTLTGSAIGNSATSIHTNIQTGPATIMATAAGAGIYIDNTGTASLTLTATAEGAGADLDFTSAGSIVLTTVTAQGNMVTLISTTGSITATAEAVNITAQTLDIEAASGIGTSGPALEVDVAEVTAADGGSGGVNMLNAGAVEITQGALTTMGSGTLTFEAGSITILNFTSGTTATLASGRSLVLETETGPIVFQNQADTIETQGAGTTITINAGKLAGSGGVAVVGNLTTVGGTNSNPNTITVTADSFITIGQLNAGTGNVTVHSANGIIISNGASPNVIAGSATLSGSAPTVRQFQLDQTEAVAAAAAANAEAADAESSLESFSSAIPLDKATVAIDTSNLVGDVVAAAAAGAIETTAEVVLVGTITAETSAAVIYEALQAIADAADGISGVAQVLPLTGDLGTDEIYAALETASATALTIDVDSTDLAVEEENANAFLIAAAVDAAGAVLTGASDLGLSSAELVTAEGEQADAQAAADNANLLSETDAVVAKQSIAALDQGTVIGSPTAPLVLQVTGAVTVTAGPTDSYLQVTGNTAVDEINASGSVSLISTGVISHGSGVGGTDITATGLTISGVNGIGTANQSLVTQVPTLNATNTTSGDIDILNTAATPAGLNITGISNTGGGNVDITDTETAPLGQGITVTGPISATGTGTDNVSINSGSPLTVAANVYSTGSIGLTAAADSPPFDNLAVDSGVTIWSNGSSVALSAGNNIDVPSGSTIEASTSINITGGKTSANVVVEGTLIGTSATIGVDPATNNNNTFTITPSATTPITVVGGTATGTNSLNFNADGLAVTILGNTITAAGCQPVTFSDFAAVNILNPAGGGSVTLNAAAVASDVMVLTGTGPGAGTFTLNGGAPISFSGVTNFTYNGAATTEAITVSPYGTPLRPWGVAVAITGGTGTATLTYNDVAGVSDNLTIQPPSAPQPGQLNVVNAGTDAAIAVVTYLQIDKLVVNGSSGAGANDTLTVNGTTGADAVTIAPMTANSATITGAGPMITATGMGQIAYNGQGGNDALTVASPAATTVTLTPGAAVDSGTVQMGTAATLVPLSYSNLGTTGTLTVANTGGTRVDTLVDNGTAANDSFTVDAGTGTVHLNSQIPVLTPGVNLLTLNGLAGDNTYTISASAGHPQPYTTIDVNGSGTSGPDVLNLNGDGSAITANLGGTSASTVGGGLGTVAISGVGVVNLNDGAGAVTISGTSLPDSFNVTPTAANAAIVQANGVAPVVNVTAAALTIGDTNPPDGDQVTVHGTTGDDAITVARGATTTVTVNALLPVAATTADTASLLISTGGGIDTITVSGSAGPAVLSVQGGQVPAGDSLTVNNTATSGNTTLTPGATNDSGTVANSDGTISFSGVTSVLVNDNGTVTTDVLTIRGTNGNDAITAAHLGSNNIVWVNAQAVVFFNGNFNQLTLDGRFGNDSVNVSPVGLTLVGANPAINVNGTASTTDTLTVFGSAAADTVAYNPGAATPNLAITGAPVVNLGIGITALTFNGQGGNDLLTITTGAGSTTVYNPGSTPDAGSVQVNSLVSLSFTNLGNGGQAVNLGGGAASSLIYSGTAASNIFTVTGLTGPTRGQVQLQINGVNQLPIVTNASVTGLTLNGVAGNDTFNVAGGLPYTTTIVEGVAVANLTNPIGNITVNLADSVLNTNTTITGYGGTVTLIGVVTANLSTAGNSLLVNGTSLNDTTTYTPTGTSAGTFTNAGLATVFNFAGDTSTFTISGQGNTANQVTVDVPAGRASVREVNRVVTVLPIGSPAPLEPVTLAVDVQIVNLIGGGGPDTFGITPAVGLQYVSDGNLDNLVVNVSNTGGSSALVIESATGGPLAPNQSVVLNHGLTPGNGIARTFTAGVEWPDIDYTNMPTVLTNGPAIPGQTGVSASETGTTVTITTPSPNGLQVGYSVMISGFTGPAAPYNGTWVITSILSPTMFTYADPVMGLPPATGGTEVPVVASQVDTAGPHINGVAISGQTSAGVNVLSASGSLTPAGQTGLSATALGTTVTITTPTPHGLLAGTGVSIAGFTGMNNAAAPYNGTWVITSVPTPTTFTYTVSVNNLPAATGGIEVPSPGQTGVSASESGTTVTVTTPSAHGLQVGNTVSIGGFTGTKAGYNGTFLVTGVPTPTTFTYTDSVTALPSATAGSEVVINTDVTITTPSAHGLQQGDSVTIGAFTGAAAGYNGTWVVTGSLTPTTFTYTDPATNLPTSATGGSEVPNFSLFALKPQSFTQGPTPLINSLTISVVDPGQVGLDPFADVNPGLYTVVGDQTGNAPVSQVIVTNNPVVTGQPATATVQLFFAQPLLDDRYTLTIDKNMVDQAGNQLAGTSNASDPISPPTFPSGHDGLPADFVARFTVNSRPHIGVDSSTEAGSSQQQLDINGNGFWDPVNAADAVNSDKAFAFGSSSDTVFSGNFAPAGQSGTGYDELGAYGQVNNQWRWLLTFNNVAEPDYSVVSNLQQNWQPVVGRFNPAINADEIGLFDGNGHWYIDFNHTNNVGGSSTVLVSDGLVGTAVVGDFDGSGHIEFATYQASKQLWTFDLTPFATTHTIVTLQMGFNDNDEANIPVAADMNNDGVTDIGLYVPPDSDGPTSGNPAGWYWLVSQGTPVVGTINTLAHPFNPSPFSNDLYYTFGSGAQSALIGHWDPPLTNGLAGPTGTPLEVVANRGQLVAEGGGVTISSTTLRVTDPDHANVPVTYTVTALPTDGELLLSGVPATVGTTFTQRDINLGHLRYQNDGSETVADSFQVTAADKDGATLEPMTVAIQVKLVNHAPTLNGNGTALTSIPEDMRRSAGDLVSAIVGNTITDPDSGALVGIAIIGATGGHGTWQYSTNGGTTWSAFGVVSASQALLLPDTDRVRFVPAANFNGLVSLQYRAWDQTSGKAGGKANLSSSASVGGSKAFSTAKATASLTVTPVNDAPTLVANSHPVVRGGEWGTTASALLAAAGAHDVDVTAVFGIAVTATTGDGWQYSTDGGTTWLDLGVVAASGVLLLDGAARLRRLPGSTGPATLTFRAWDGTQGVAGETNDLSAADSVGGGTAFSQVSVKAVWKS